MAVIGSFEVLFGLGTPSIDNAPVVQTVDSAIHQVVIDQTLDSTIHWITRYPMDNIVIRKLVMVTGLSGVQFGL